MKMPEAIAEPTPDTPEDVLDLLRKQDSMYTELESVSSRQRSLITGDDAGPLLTLLTDRQKLSDQLHRIATRLAPIRREWDGYRGRFTAAQRTEADQLLSETGRRLQRLIENDEQDARVLSGRKQAVAQTLRATHSTSQAISAYRTPSDSLGRVSCVDEGA